MIRKIGDLVRIKLGAPTISNMNYSNQIAQIMHINNTIPNKPFYHLDIDDGYEYWTDDMFEKSIVIKI
jgi:hypothetical protein